MTDGDRTQRPLLAWSALQSSAKTQHVGQIIDTLSLFRGRKDQTDIDVVSHNM